MDLDILIQQLERNWTVVRISGHFVPVRQNETCKEVETFVNYAMKLKEKE